MRNAKPSRSVGSAMVGVPHRPLLSSLPAVCVSVSVSVIVNESKGKPHAGAARILHPRPGGPPPLRRQHAENAGPFIPPRKSLLNHNNGIQDSGFIKIQDSGCRIEAIHRVKQIGAVYPHCDVNMQKMQVLRTPLNRSKVDEFVPRTQHVNLRIVR